MAGFVGRGRPHELRRGLEFELLMGSSTLDHRLLLERADRARVAQARIVAAT